MGSISKTRELCALSSDCAKARGSHDQAARIKEFDEENHALRVPPR
jgi:hypothetical protein